MHLRFTSATLLLASVFALSSCFEKSKDDPTPGNGVSDNLHFAFATPDWQRTIDCTHLDLTPNWGADSVLSVSATSASTNNTFRLWYPSDSSALVNPASLGKYPINSYSGGTAGRFKFALRLPITEGGNSIYSTAGFPDDSYNEVVEVKYVSSTADFAIFRIKARYKLLAADATDASITRVVSGTYHFQIKARRL